MLWGKKLQNVILSHFQDKHGIKKLALDTFAVRGDHHSASADAVVYNKKAKSHQLIESKTASFFSMKNWDTSTDTKEGLPLHVYLQIQWQLYCYELEIAHVALLGNTSSYSEFVNIPADPSVQEKCLALADNFWWHVVNKQPPPPVSIKDTEKLFSNAEPLTKQISVDEPIFEEGDIKLTVQSAIDRYKNIKSKKKKIDKEVLDLKTAFILLLGEANILENEAGDVLVKKIIVETLGVSKEASSIISKLSKQDFRTLCENIRAGELSIVPSKSFKGTRDQRLKKMMLSHKILSENFQTRLMVK